MNGPTVEFSGGLLDGVSFTLPTKVCGTQMWDRFVIVWDADKDAGFPERRMVYELMNFAMDNTWAKYVLEE